MKNLTLFAFSLMILFGSCVKEIEELPYNIFDDPEYQLFSITDWVTHHTTTTTEQIFFDHNFDLKDYHEISRIYIHYNTPDGPKKKTIYSPGEVYFFYLLDFEPGFPYCFEFEVDKANDDASRRDIPICPEW